MMKRAMRSVLLTALALGLFGCGQPAAPPAAVKSTGSTQPPAERAPARTAQAPAARQPIPAQDSPTKAVQIFLTAVRDGNDEEAAAMLTDLAREKTSQHNLVVAPPGSPSASFEIGTVELDAEGGACVEATWTDLDETGEPKSDSVLWLLRHEPKGWRVAGVAAKVFDDQPALLLNFEDPEDMIRKQQMVRDEIERRVAEEVPMSTADAENPENSVRR